MKPVSADRRKVITSHNAFQYNSLSGATGPAPTYLDMFRHDAGEIAKALTS